ncbi:MAG: 2-iminoacetate synthase ThiH [Verrucomicrobiota bacterium]|jgi:2-iminoacetate synthase|nr:2-iminoacetate synthase ThiH [Verrucomicrobiota bacterium]
MNSSSSSPILPPSIDPAPWLNLPPPDAHAVEAALASEAPDEAAFVALVRADPAVYLERMAQRAQALTRRQFGRTIQLYAPLYLSNYCSGGCAYCGYAADRKQVRLRLEADEIERELAAMKQLGFELVLLLTGERNPRAGFDYLEAAVRTAAGLFHEVTVEAFPMETAEYRALAEAGCTGITIYQETYDAAIYPDYHRWGPKRDYAGRLQAPERALSGGVSSVGLGALLGLADPLFDTLALYRHVRDLQSRFWRAAFSVSFPRLRPEAGGFQAPHPVTDRALAQIIFAFRICLPETTLVLSTREAPAFRDGLAGVGINRMSAGSRTTVGGYDGEAEDEGQFIVSDSRDVAAFCAMLRARGLDPVFKNWDSAYRTVLA